MRRVAWLPGLGAVRGMATLAPAAMAALALLAGLGGCGVRGSLVGNQPPETTVWVTGDVDTVAHTVRVFWNGEDMDGEVTGFEFRWLYEPGAQPAGYDSSVWSFTDRRDSLFTVYAPTGVDFPTLVVRAVDDAPDGAPEGDGVDHGTPDPTPVRQRFVFSNAAPTVQFTGTPPDTTLPVAVFRWSANDPDGIVSRASYRVWLDGRPDLDTIVTGQGITLPPHFFRDAGGAFEERRRTAYVVAIDAGGRASLPDSFSWTVRAPRGTTLLVDEMPGSGTIYDNFYRGELAARLGEGNYTVLDLEAGSHLGTADAIRETFLLFDHVFWSAENNPAFSPVLAQAGQPIRDFLGAGGDLYLASPRLVGTGGAQDEDFAREVLGAVEVRVNQVSGTTGFTVANGQFLLGGGAPFDSLRSSGIHGGVEAYVLADPTEAAYVAPQGTLDTLNAEPWPVGVSRRYGAGQGRLVYVGFPLRGMNSAFSGHPGTPGIELRKIFDLFGM